MGESRIMKIVFFGTPEYVVPLLDKLHRKFKTKLGKSPIVAVVTQKPKPVGRKQELSFSPVDTWAYRKKIPIYFEPLKIIQENIKADLGILASYGEIIPKKVIDHFPFGILNIHPSLLPKYRGASPVQAAIVSGDKETGVTIIKLDEKLDHGPIVSQFTEEISENDTSETLRTRVFERSAEVLATLIPAYIKGKINPREQEHSQASFTRQIKKEDGFIPPELFNPALTGVTPVNKTWEIPFIKNYSLVPNAYAKGASSAYCLDRFIRAMYSWPVAWTNVNVTSDKKQVTRRLKILKAHVEKPVHSSYHLVPDFVQLEGKSPVTWKQFLEGYPEAKFS